VRDFNTRGAKVDLPSKSPGYTACVLLTVPRAFGETEEACAVTNWGQKLLMLPHQVFLVVKHAIACAARIKMYKTMGTYSSL